MIECLALWFWLQYITRYIIFTVCKTSNSTRSSLKLSLMKIISIVLCFLGISVILVRLGRPSLHWNALKPHSHDGSTVLIRRNGHEKLRSSALWNSESQNVDTVKWCLPKPLCQNCSARPSQRPITAPTTAKTISQCIYWFVLYIWTLLWGCVEKKLTSYSSLCQRVSTI